MANSMIDNLLGKLHIDPNIAENVGTTSEDAKTKLNEAIEKARKKLEGANVSTPNQVANKEKIEAMLAKMRARVAEAKAANTQNNNDTAVETVAEHSIVDATVEPAVLTPNENEDPSAEGMSF